MAAKETAAEQRAKKIILNDFRFLRHPPMTAPAR